MLNAHKFHNFFIQIVISTTSLSHQTTTDITFISNATITDNFTIFLQTVIVANSNYPALASKTATNPP